MKSRVKQPVMGNGGRVERVMGSESPHFAVELKNLRVKIEFQDTGVGVTDFGSAR